MKRIFALIMIVMALFNLCACGAQGGGETTPSATEETQPKIDVTATEADIAKLEGLYSGRVAYHGDLHDHANTGGTSDGKNTLDEWKENLKEKDMDFVAIVDHKQLAHMYLPEWDDSLFIGGSEAATNLWDVDVSPNEVHYNMLFSDPEGLRGVLNKYMNRFQFLNGDNFQYTGFSTEEMRTLGEVIREHNGLLVHVHPKGDKYLQSDNVLDYWFGEETGFEVLCGCYGNMSAPENQKAYVVWTELLAMGKRVFATSGSDSHRLSNTVSLATIYSEKKDSGAYLGYVRQGDLTAGPVGIRMSIGDTITGGVGSFAGNRLVVSVGDFHSQEYKNTHIYRVDVYDDQGLVFSQELKGSATEYFAIDVDETAKFYRAVVVDTSDDYIFAVGNPIWNQQ